MKEVHWENGEKLILAMYKEILDLHFHHAKGYDSVTLSEKVV